MKYTVILLPTCTTLSLFEMAVLVVKRLQTETVSQHSTVIRTTLDVFNNYKLQRYHYDDASTNYHAPLLLQEVDEKSGVKISLPCICIYFLIEAVMISMILCLSTTLQLVDKFFSCFELIFLLTRCSCGILSWSFF